MKTFIFVAFFIHATAGVSPFTIFNLLRWVSKSTFLGWPLIDRMSHSERLRAPSRIINLKSFISESKNFESAAIRYLPRELFATKITKRHDFKSFKSKPNKKPNTNILKKFLMTHYVELIWNKTIFLYFLLENIWSPVLRTLNGLWTEKCPTETHVGNK